MPLFSKLATGAVGAIHVYIVVLEMFLWDTPRGHKAFKLAPDFATKTRVLAANQGLYNGFLAAGLFWGLAQPVEEFAAQIRLFFLGCVGVAGVYGAATASRKILSGSDFEVQDDDSRPEKPSRKRPKIATASTASGSSRPVKFDSSLSRSLFAQEARKATKEETCLPPSRQHSILYHRPLLLDEQVGSRGRKALLSWFDSVSQSRSMPWRKAWVDPKTISDPAELRKTLEKRAYEVWISEIMLQQTRVAVVIDYWSRWMAKWPTIHDLAAAKPEDVLSAWSGLGYYSRATRIHEAAKLAVGDPDMDGLLPSSAKDLEAKIPGVGRYTAGAISCIVFGRAEPMVDGNVLRVLSRQLGIHGNIKTGKAVIDAIWAAADAMVKATSELDSVDGETSSEPNDRPGRWGQALMELGSTICTLNPNCSQCPITATCRVYKEGELKASKSKEKPKRIADIEDAACILCEPFEDGERDSDDDSTQDKSRSTGTNKIEARQGKQATLAAFAFTRKPAKGASSSSSPSATSAAPSKATMDTITAHARRFPVKAIKKAVREEETLVCAIRRSDGQYLIHRRPLKGLLAGLWEFPSQLLEQSTKPDKRKREQLAMGYVSSLLGGSKGTKKKPTRISCAGELGSVPWLFSHIKLTMHVFLFEVGDDAEVTGDEEQPRRWVAGSDVDAESMGTGMRKCWEMVNNALKEL
ncbi:DNA glycosylase [Trichoderma citrinoviride]|uniref:Adenine DNA glycosylase n=1 Tax=Trichoderma citrinoviride TaxID=58853 RepID=A0A2T4BA80_9HYPO|nr:DNA glycosylase [Trichoderma citrinoviride]PTB66119.1 DNA glycosylase [Trichoderma citrinoviride]